MNEYKYSISCATQDKKKFYTFATNGKYPNPIDFNITTDPTRQSIYGDITIHNVKKQACDELVLTYNPRINFIVQFYLGYKSNYSRVFTGLCVESTKEVDDNLLTSITLNLQGGVFNGTPIKLNFNVGTTNYQIKQTIANMLKLTLKSAIDNDNDIIQEQKIIDTFNPIAELKRLFPEQNVFVVDDKLCFFPANASTKRYLKPTIKHNKWVMVDKIQKIQNTGTYEYTTKFLLFPQISVGDYIEVKQTNIYKQYNGLYLVRMTRHSGNIDYRGESDASTTCILQDARKLFLVQ